jgi:SAM-dependent methyltransferase
VLEVGARNVNGSLRSFVEGFAPSRYVGVDVEPGAGVDEMCRAEEVRRRFGEEAFDLLISTELIEHVRDWQRVLTNFKSVLRPNGVMLITTRSMGFPYHGYPHDYWRYEVSDMERIFADFEIDVLTTDPSEPGVFIKARKPAGYAGNDLSGIRLYSMITQRRERAFSRLDLFALGAASRRERWKAGERPEFLRRYLLAPAARIRHACPWRAEGATLPFGCIDSPKNDSPKSDSPKSDSPMSGETLAGEIQVTGWALGDDPIVEVSICVDRKFTVTGRLYGYRPDVAAAYPSCQFAGISGWSANIHAADLSGGDHELIVRALTAAGTIGNIGAVRVSIARQA